MMNHVGYRPESPGLYRVYNFLFAAALLVVLFPVIVVLMGALLVTQGPKIFYRGPRLGKDKQSFDIIKFRTLCDRRAREITQDCTLPANSNIETPLGRMLRETRLDELPQLINIIQGDMNICGPRPVREEIADKERQRIPEYDRRFEVKPGLVGPTQAYFGHGASKRVRARMNNLAVRRPVNIRAELALLGGIGAAILEKLAGKVKRKVTGQNASDQDELPNIWVTADGRNAPVPLAKVDFDHLETLGVWPAELPAGKAKLNVRLANGGLRSADVILGGAGENGHFDYETPTEFGQFIVDRYALGQAVVSPKLDKISARKTVDEHIITPVGALQT